MLRYLIKVVSRLDITKSDGLQFLRVFYVAILWMLLGQFNYHWEALLFDPPRHPIEIVFWLKYLPYPYTLFLIVFMAFVSSVAAIWRVEQQSIRVACFVFNISFHASTMNADQIDHNTLFFIYPLFFFMWIPTSAWKNFEEGGREWVARTIHAATLCLGLCMTFAGLVKTVRGIYAAIVYNEGIFASWQGFGQIVADELPLLDAPTRAALMVFNHPIASHLLFLGGVAFEVAAVFLVIRPKFYKLLGIWFIGFQMGTSVIMNIYFQGASLIMILFLLASPLKERLDDKAK